MDALYLMRISLVQIDVLLELALYNLPIYDLFLAQHCVCASPQTDAKQKLDNRNTQ